MNERLRGTEAKIRSFADLRPGWRFGEGGRVPPERIETALAIHRGFERAGFLTTNAFLGANGEPRVTAYDGPRYLELTVETHGGILFVYEEDGIEKDCAERLELAQAVECINRYAATEGWR